LVIILAEIAYNPEDMVESSCNQSQHWINDNDGFDFSKTNDADYSSALLAMVPNKKHVLYVGCGAGRNITLLQEHFSQIALLDRNPDTLSQAKKIAGKYLSSAVCVNIQDLKAY